MNARYFDLSKFRSYLEKNISGASLSMTHRKDKDIFRVSDLQKTSFEFADIDELGSDSFTSGNYKNAKTGNKGYWEEFRLRISSPVHFKNACQLPTGKYRVRVQHEQDWPKPIVRTFIRGFMRWKKFKLQKNLPLSEILGGELKEYSIAKD